jgi:hypothetical protein
MGGCLIFVQTLALQSSRNYCQPIVSDYSDPYRLCRKPGFVGYELVAECSEVLGKSNHDCPDQSQTRISA